MLFRSICTEGRPEKAARLCRQPGPLASLFPPQPQGISSLPPNLLPPLALGLPPQVSSQDSASLPPRSLRECVCPSLPPSLWAGSQSALWCPGLPRTHHGCSAAPYRPCWPLSSLVWPVLSGRINLGTRVGVPLSLQCEHPPEGTLLLRGRVLPHGDTCDQVSTSPGSGSLAGASCSQPKLHTPPAFLTDPDQIGRASCRERVSSPV